MISGFVGGPAGTNYGENISTMAITKSVFLCPYCSPRPYWLWLCPSLRLLIQGNLRYSSCSYRRPGNISFRTIAAQGMAIMIQRTWICSVLKNIAVIASIVIIGLGGQYAFGGNIPFFGVNVPCIAGAAIFGIVLNLILSMGGKIPQERRGR